MKRTLQRMILRLYERLYDALCGVHPGQRPWHFQWLPVRIVIGELRAVLAALEGEILDVGCGTRPYDTWVRRASRYVGADLQAGPHVDVVIPATGRWPIETAAFDAVLCTQVIEHVQELEALVAELHRVLRPDGRAVITIPFIYHEHGRPHDYRRLTSTGLRTLLRDRFEVEQAVHQGAVASTLATLWLGWINMVITRTTIRLAVTLVALPLWLAFAFGVNLLAVVLDRLDSTNAFYGNVLVVARKR